MLAKLIVAWGLASFPTDIQPIADELKASSLFILSVAAISVVSSSIVAGSVAGRIAGRRPILHGALSSCAWLTLLVCIGLGSPPPDQPALDSGDAGLPISATLSAVLFFGAPLFGAFGGHLAQKMAHRPAVTSSQYSKWWWLGYFGVQSWTVEERRARIAMGMTLLVSFFAAMFIVSTVLDWFGIEVHRAAVISAVLSVVFGLFAARPIATELYRDLLRRADESARRRLSGTNGEVH